MKLLNPSTVHKIWHASDFIQIFSKGHNSRKGDNLDKKKGCVNYFSMRNPYMEFQNPCMHGSKDIACIKKCDERMHRCIDNPKPMPSEA